MATEYNLRAATAADAETVLALIHELAAYEQRLDEFTCTKEQLVAWVFEKQRAEVLLCEVAGEAIGYVFFREIFSTFGGDCGLYLDDLFVLPQFRGQGLGKACFQKLCSIATERGYSWMEWDCLTWNEPSIQFYYAQGAAPVTKYVHFALDKTGLARHSK